MTLQPWTVCLFLACCIGAAAGAESSVNDWRLTRDDVNGEYTGSVVKTVRSLVHCIIQGESTADAVQFDEAQMLCRLFVCRGGWSGCRKCRIAANSSQPQVWVRKLDDRHACWRTFQHRVDASVDFNQSWAAYVSGFGQGENANFWIGLDNLTSMTKNSALPVRWEFSDWNDTLYWMEHAFFKVDDAATKYRVSVGEQLMDKSTVKQCNPADDSNVRMLMNGRSFSTYDNDNDASGVNCATDFGGGWWMRDCFCWHPNGLYVNPPEAFAVTRLAKGISMESAAKIYPFNFYYSMKTFECLLLQQVDA